MTTPLEAVRTPSTSHLTPARLTKLGVELDLQRRFRVAQLEDLAAAAAEPASSTDAARRQITRALTVAAESVLSDIDAALNRLQRGTYGKCQQCAAPIPFERLEALPMTRLCMPCQYAIETSRPE
jgi:RNA polymerase-binding transcription factor DksA